MWQLAAKWTQKLPAELAHDTAVFALAHGLAPIADQILLPVKAAGLSFDNPLGLAAGFDKNAVASQGAIRLGFGFAEVGTITPHPQPGNPKPRLFRLPEDGAVINRYGFNSKGMQVARDNLRKIHHRQGIVGVNIGANKTTQDRVADYYTTAHYLAGDADYLTVNISSPNTPGLRDLQHEAHIKQVLQAAIRGRDEAIGQVAARPPVFVKLAPDIETADLYAAMDASLAAGVNGFILTNTTIARPDDLQSPYRDQTGGLSGQPLTQRALEVLCMAATHLGRTGAKDIVLVGAGGIGTAEQAYARLLVGADLLQLYTALALQGPYIVVKLLRQLKAMMRADGVDSLSRITGVMASSDQARSHAAHISRIAVEMSKNN